MCAIGKISALIKWFKKKKAMGVVKGKNKQLNDKKTLTTRIFCPQFPSEMDFSFSEKKGRK